MASLTPTSHCSGRLVIIYNMLSAPKAHSVHEGSLMLLHILWVLTNKMMLPTLIVHTEQLHCTKILCALPYSFFPPPSLWQPLSFYCLHSSVFSRMSYSQIYIVCSGLFKLASFLSFALKILNPGVKWYLFIMKKQRLFQMRPQDPKIPVQDYREKGKIFQTKHKK